MNPLTVYLQAFFAAVGRARRDVAYLTEVTAALIHVCFRAEAIAGETIATHRWFSHAAFFRRPTDHA